MHAVLVKVTIRDREAAQKRLDEQIVPQVSKAPGFVTGHWTWKDANGLSLVIFESEEQAAAMSERVRSMINEDEVTLEDVEVRDVVANA